MRISCIVTCYNQEATVGEAIRSLLGQARRPDEIVVADDGSTDGSRQLIESMANEHPIITPVFRERNLGVTINRDLAVRQTDADFVTALDGDDYHLPGKLAGESAAITRTSAPIAFSDQRLIHVETGQTDFEHLGSFATFSKKERVRWMLAARTHVPRDVLVAKDLHIKMGGYRRQGEPYEDWDYKIRLAAIADQWAYSGVEGVVHRLHAGGLSQISFIRHAVKRITVIRDNRDLIQHEAGPGFYYGMILFTLAWAAKWQTRSLTWRAQQQIHRFRPQTDGQSKDATM
ncbi:MAG TPA: glycosyltransferase [Actinomycetota bacterium]|nr:glycosyltransferase [Actinomycetota bacterium]